jgi:hypothetical protein
MLFGFSLGPYIIAGGLALAIGGAGVAYVKGYNNARLQCREAELQAELDTLKRDLAAWKAADAVEAMLEADLAAERKSLEEKVAEYELELQSRPDARCSLTDDDVRRLRLERGR